MELKPIKKYYFSVEGETECWYLSYLENMINKSQESQFKVSFYCRKDNPIKFTKKLTITSKIEIYHLLDYEGDEAQFINRFTNAIDNMNLAMKLGKQIKYKFGYSNLTFDLWIILHKCNCQGSVIDRNKYIEKIKSAYNLNVESLREYKHEDNFKFCLSQLQLSDVINAVNRAKIIMKNNCENGYKLCEYKKFKYYKENPSLMIYEPIEKILIDCGLM